jgi:Do/DeqQ family serine protease
MRQLIAAGAALALFLAAVAVLAPQPRAAADTVPATAAEMQLSFAPVVRAAAPAVVNIYATRIVADRASPFADDPFFRDLFGDFRRAQPRVQNSLGSGVIVSPDGLVVSNHHVVGGATDIRVVLNDRREYAADLVLTDAESDIAVLRLRDAPALPHLAMADSDTAQVGDLVLAIGNPFGVGQTVSSGIVSGLGRSTLSLGAGRGYFIQTDAAINPGNSGGALVDMQGRLLGINTAILTRGGGSNGVGFAVPANLVAAVVAQAQAGADRFDRPWAGVTGQAVDMGVAQALGLPAPDGVLLSDLHPQSPFAAAGLVAGDVILTLDGQPVASPQEMMHRLAVAGTGRDVVVGYWHDGARRDATATLSPPPQGDRDVTTLTDDVALRGLTVGRLDPALTVELGLPLGAEGVAVLAAGDRAARAGLRPGDLILGINGAAVQTPGDVAALATMAARRWSIDLVRNGEPLRLLFRS